MNVLHAARTPAYLMLRVCERLNLSEEQFLQADYHRQVRWLAYEMFRQQEEQAPHGAGE